MKALEEWALTHNVPYVDIIKASDNDRDILLSWVHLTPAGNQIIANAFATKILDEIGSGNVNVH